MLLSTDQPGTSVLPAPERTAIISRESVAVLLIDMQENFLKEIYRAVRETLVEAQCQLLADCAAWDVPVVLIEMGGAGATEDALHRKLRQVPRLVKMTKPFDSGFTDTRLHEILRGFKAETILLAGINQSACVFGTALSAKKFGYQVATSKHITADAWTFDPAFGARTEAWFQKHGSWHDAPVTFSCS